MTVDHEIVLCCVVLQVNAYRACLDISVGCQCRSHNLKFGFHSLIIKKDQIDDIDLTPIRTGNLLLNQINGKLTKGRRVTV